MVRIIVAIVVKIVTSRCSDSCDHVQVVKLCQRAQVAIFNEHIHHLRDISTVEIVMVGYFSAIPGIYGSKEADQLVVVYHHRLIFGLW